ncbi:MAG: apolipoprotein N-acyltransferase, partial [Candidatus Puniceispirillaceae bacterium]
HSGGLLGQYHKQHLVPFGEYIPFRQLPFIDAIAGQGEFSNGRAVEDIYIEPFGYIRVLICYEIIFPAFIARDKRRPDMLITLSNDAWFGNTSGPHQHFYQSRLRAIEEGLAVYRLANTGVSGGFDGFGRLLGKTDLGTRAVIDLPHIGALAPPFYAKNRITAPVLLFVWLGVLAIFLELFSKRRNKSQG